MNDILFLLIPASSILWSIFFLLPSIFRVKIHKITGNKLTQFQKYISYSSIQNNDEPFGWFIGKYFIGYIQRITDNHSSQKEMYVLTSEKQLKKYVSIKDNDNDSDGNEETGNELLGLTCSDAETTYCIDIYDREGSFWALQYIKYQYYPLDYEIRQNQQCALDAMMQTYNAKKHCVSLLHGPPGTGKSIVAILLAKHLISLGKEVSFVDSFKPWEPNDTFSTLYHHISPTKHKPLIVVIEEIDTVIAKIHEPADASSSMKKSHQHLPIMISNKCDWNSFLDKFDRRRYVHVFLILTANNSAEFFDALDPSYMRSGRVDVKMLIE
jgi:hypothetical protein